MQDIKKARLPLLDALRGFAIINVVLYHFLYDIYVIYEYNPDWPQLLPIHLWQRLGCSLFVLLAGMALHMGKHTLRRGLQLNALGIVITLITYWLTPEQVIYYGILNFFGCAMLAGWLLRPLLSKVKPMHGLLFSAAFYLGTQHISDGWVQLGSWRIWQWPEILYDDRLALLGFHSSEFYSADYVPLLPHIFVFIGGWFLYAWLESAGRLHWLKYGDLQLLTLPGRHSLLIYLLHQPLLMGLCKIVFAA